MPSTFVHAFLPSLGLIPVKRTLGALTKAQWIRLLFIAAFLGNSPDWDIVPASFAGEAWKSIHRNLGHNLLSLTLLVILGRWILQRFIGSPLTRFQCWALSFGLVASHVFLDSMQDVNHEGVVRGVPLFWPVSPWELSLPFRLFKIIHLKPDIHFLWAHITSSDFWTNAVFYEIGNSVLLWLAWYAVVRCSLLLSRTFTSKAVNVETKDGQIVSLDLPLSRRDNPAPPSPRPQDDTPNRKGINFR